MKWTSMPNNFCQTRTVSSMERCKNFVTLTASVYHPMLQKQLPLATRECKSEDSANIGRFWTNFNKTFKGLTKTDKKFSPARWITDMTTANFNGLQLIYDEEVLHKIKGCEFHFCQSINRHVSKCSDQERLYFMNFMSYIVPLSTK